jgi:hypothetical protein
MLLSPVFLLVLFVFSLLAHEEMLGGEHAYPPWSITVGWIMTGTTVSCIPLYIIYKFLITPGSISHVSFILYSHNILGGCLSCGVRDKIKE